MKEENLRVGRFDKSRHFEAELRDELIKRIEAGTPRSVIAYQYGVSRAAISKWMSTRSSEQYRSKRLGDQLTDVEKRSIVRQIEQGSLTPYAARQIYGLSGNTLNR